MIDDNVPIPQNIITLMKMLCEVAWKWPEICPKPKMYDDVVQICKVLFPSMDPNFVPGVTSPPEMP